MSWSQKNFVFCNYQKNFFHINQLWLNLDLERESLGLFSFSIFGLLI